MYDTDDVSSYNPQVSPFDESDTAESEAGKSSDPCEHQDWIRFDFSNEKSFERTLPVFCSIGGKEYSGRNWARILSDLTENEIHKRNPALSDLTTQNVIISRRERPFFLKEKIEGLHCEFLSNGYWINLNYNIPHLIEIIAALSIHCGYSKDEIVLCGISRTPGATAGVTSPDQPTKTYDIALAEAEKYLLSAGRKGATAQELIDAVRPGTALAPTKRTLENSTNVISMPDDKYVHADAFVDLDEAAETIGRILKTHFASFNGYSNKQLLFNAATQDLSMFLNDNDCEDADSVYQIARFLFEKRAVAGHPYTFSASHIFEAAPDFPATLKGLMVNYARHNSGLLRSDDAKEYLRQTLQSNGNIGQILHISQDNTFLIYSSNSYLLSEMLGIKDEWVSTLHAKLDNLFREANVAYVIPRDIRKEWFQTLPALPMSLGWTPLLLQDIMQKFPDVGFKSVKSDLSQPYDTLAAAFVQSDSQLQTFPDVVTLFLQDRHTLPWRTTCDSLRLELKEAGMLDGNELIYALPKALKDPRFAWSDEGQTVYVRGN